MINKISFKNYKLFKDKQDLELERFTIIIGKNNTGKSAVLKLLSIIESSLSGRFKEPISLNDSEVYIADFLKDLIYGQSNRALEIKIEQNNFKGEKDFLKTDLFVENDNFKISYWNCNDKLKFEIIDRDTYLFPEYGEKVNVKFNGINIKNIEYNKDKLDLSSFDSLPKLELNIDYLSGIRKSASSFYPYEFKNEIKSGINGENLYQFLIEDSQTTNKKYFTSVSNWIKEKFEGWELKIEYDGYRKDLPARIFLEKGSLKINLSQTGSGIAQILPLIIRAYKPCEKETLIVIEEPESHLHPFAHAQLAQLFFESIKDDTNKKYIIETHSQNFVLRLRRLVAEGKLNQDDINIYYVDYDEYENLSKLEKIIVNKDGSVEKWPEGVFGETVLEARAIMNANLNELRDVD